MKWTDTFCKAVTFSYDDGVTQDRRFVELLNRYHLKCTFNINSGIGPERSRFSYRSISIYRIPHEELKQLYAGHEVAIHSYSHPNLASLSIPEIHDEVTIDKDNLERLFEYPIIGMAYPFGQYNDFVVNQLKQIGIRYARTVENNHRFEPQTDLLRFQPTSHHNDPLLPTLISEFLASHPTQPKIMYIWGHSYEFDSDDGWKKIESIFQMLAGHNDIFYGTNAEVLLDCIDISECNSKVIE